MTTANEVVSYSQSLVNTKVTVPTNPYGGQCVAFIDHVVQHFSNKNLAYTNAIDCLTKAKQQGLEVIYNDTSNANLIPQPGDFFVMRVAEHQFGHIGVVVSATTQGMVTLEQNIDGWSDNNGNGINDQLEIGGGGYVRNNRRNYAGVIGWFRLPYNGQSSTPSNSNGKLKDEKGTFKIGISLLNVRDKPSVKGKVVAQYKIGQSVNYDSVYVADGYIWVSYVSTSGKRRYIACGVARGNVNVAPYGTFR